MPVSQFSFFVARETNQIYLVEPMAIRQNYQSSLEMFSAEAQQIWQTANHNTIVGGRFQSGNFHTHNLQTDPDLYYVLWFDPDNPAARQEFTTGFERMSAYGYHQWQIIEPFFVVVGLSYDHVTYPKNFRAAPISDEQEQVDQLSPKAGLIWTPAKDTTVRAAYTQSLGGTSIDQSLQLEPSEVAGFLQSFRSNLPESVGGAEAGASFETFGISLEQSFPTRTYLCLAGEILHSEMDRTLGAFEANFAGFALPADMRDHLDYTEASLLFTFNQLLGKEWAVGVRYRLSDTSLKDTYPEVLEDNPAGLIWYQPSQHLQSTLHQLSMHILYNHPSGFFAKAQALWYLQSNRGYSFAFERQDIYGNILSPGSVPDRPGDEFWQFNVLGGYRFPRRRAEILVGLLNVTGQDYRLNPITLYYEPPRERTLVARLQFNF
jgi:outer membrane receptor protein involved in Fe transport